MHEWTTSDTVLHDSHTHVHDCLRSSQDDHQNETSVILHAVGTSFVLLIVLANPALLGGGVLARTCACVCLYLLLCRFCCSR